MARGRRGLFPTIFACSLSLALPILLCPAYLFPDIHATGIFTGLENDWTDWIYRRHKLRLAPADPRIVIAAIDDETVRELGWPFPRDQQARLIAALARMGAKVIAFDVQFLDPDQRYPAHDASLIEATRRAGRVIHLADLEKKVDGADVRFVARMPLEGLAKASLHVGHPNVEEVLDDDGHLRRMRPFSGRVRYPLDYAIGFPSLNAAAAAAFEGKSLREYRSRLPTEIELNFRALQGWEDHPYWNGTRRERRIQLVWAPYRVISIADLLEGRLTPEQAASVRGALAFVGSSIPGLYDHYPMPFSVSQAGVEFHAAAVDNYLHGDYHLRAPGSRMLWIFLGAIWLPVLLTFAPPMAAAAGGLLALAGWFEFWDRQFFAHVRYDFVAPAAAFLLSYLAMALWRMLTEGRQNRLTRQMFSQYLAPEVVEDLIRRGEMPALGGEKRDMTVMFLDIAHFTGISERMPPEALIQFLNRYLTALSEVVLKHRGVVDKYIGDCVMAFWNAPQNVPDHRVQACLAAVECLQTVEKLNAERHEPPLPEPPAIRIGINSGVMVVGNTGSAQKFSYTVLGDEVNLSSRLEGANKFFASQAMASEDTFKEAVSLVEGRLLGRIRVVGKANPIKVYELLAEKGKLPAPWPQALPLYEKGVAAFYARDFAAAKGLFRSVLEILPKDVPSRIYFDMSETYASAPPSEDWDWVFNLTAK